MLRPAAPPVARHCLQAIREVGTRLRSVVLKWVDAPLVLRPHDWVSPPVRGFGVISLWGDTKQSRECAPQVLASEIHHEAGEKGLEQGPPPAGSQGDLTKLPALHCSPQLWERETNIHLVQGMQNTYTSLGPGTRAAQYTTHLDEIWDVSSISIHQKFALTRCSVR